MFSWFLDLKGSTFSHSSLSHHRRHHCWRIVMDQLSPVTLWISMCPVTDQCPPSGSELTDTGLVVCYCNVIINQPGIVYSTDFRQKVSGCLRITGFEDICGIKFQDIEDNGRQDCVIWIHLASFQGSQQCGKPWTKEGIVIGYANGFYSSCFAPSKMRITLPSTGNCSKTGVAGEIMDPQPFHLYSILYSIHDIPTCLRFVILLKM